MKRLSFLELTIGLLLALIFTLLIVAPQVGAWQASTSAHVPNAAPICANAAIHVNSNYTYALGSADFSDADGDPETGSTFRWLKNGSVVISDTQPVSESLLLHFDNAVTGVSGEVPASSAQLTIPPAAVSTSPKPMAKSRPCTSTKSRFLRVQRKCTCPCYDADTS